MDELSEHERELAAQAEAAVRDLAEAERELEQVELRGLTWDGEAVDRYKAAIWRVEEAAEAVDAFVVFAPAGWSRRRP